MKGILGPLFDVLFTQFTTCFGGGIFDQDRWELARHGRTNLALTLPKDSD